MAPRETENNAYAKFWGDKQRTLWYVMVFLEWSIRPDLKSPFYLENDFGRKKVDFFPIQLHRTFRLFHFVIALIPCQLRQLLCYPPN